MAPNQKRQNDEDEERKKDNWQVFGVPDEEDEEVEVEEIIWPPEWNLWIAGWTVIETPGYVSLVNSEF